MKYVEPLTEAETITLREASRYGPTLRLRQRAQALLWSAQGYAIKEIAALLAVHRVSVSSWIDDWRRDGLRGLYDQRRPGRPTIYNEEEAQRFRDLLEANPRQVKQAQAQLQEETGKIASTKTVKRLLKKNAPLETLPPVTENQTR